MPVAPSLLILRESAALRVWTRQLIGRSQKLVITFEVLRAESLALREGSDTILEDLRLAALSRALARSAGR
jgi:hypothetical protein